MTESFVAAGVVIACAVAIIVAERLWPYDRQRLLRAGLGVDLIGYALIQSWFLGLVITGLVGHVDQLTGASDYGFVSGWPWYAQLGLFVVSHDFYIYWFHRLQHRNRFLWRIHEAHHSVREVDWIAGARSHALEILINQSIEVGAMTLLGASPPVMLAKGVISIVWGMWIHANIDVRSGALQYVINGPEMHRWHHAVDFVAPGHNFATKFAFWDYMFGTVRRPNRKPRGYGLGQPFPEHFLAQQAYAFRTFETAPDVN